MRILTIIAALVGLSMPLKADEFHLGKDRVITGVLIGEVDGRYQIRVEGGTIEIPKSSVTKVVKDSLATSDVQKAEEAKREALAKADAERRVRQAAAREARLAALKAYRARLDAERAARAAVTTCNPTPYRRTFRNFRSNNHRVRVYNPTTRTTERYWIRSR